MRPLRGLAIVTPSLDAWGSGKVAGKAPTGSGLVPKKIRPKIGPKNQLDRRLHQTGRGRPDVGAESGAIQIAVDRGWSEKLCVIENVEGLHASRK
jgi:hypothetical protein